MSFQKVSQKMAKVGDDKEFSPIFALSTGPVPCVVMPLADVPFFMTQPVAAFPSKRRGGLRFALRLKPLGIEAALRDAGIPVPDPGSADWNWYTLSVSANWRLQERHPDLFETVLNADGESVNQPVANKWWEDAEELWKWSKPLSPQTEFIMDGTAYQTVMGFAVESGAVSFGDDVDKDGKPIPEIDWSKFGGARILAYTRYDADRGRTYVNGIKGPASIGATWAKALGNDNWLAENPNRTVDGKQVPVIVSLRVIPDKLHNEVQEALPASMVEYFKLVVAADGPVQTSGDSKSTTLAISNLVRSVAAATGAPAAKFSMLPTKKAGLQVLVGVAQILFDASLKLPDAMPDEDWVAAVQDAYAPEQPGSDEAAEEMV